MTTDSSLTDGANKGFLPLDHQACNPATTNSVNNEFVPYESSHELRVDLSQRDIDESLLIHGENARKDRIDEAQDARRMHGSKTIDQFFRGDSE